MKRFLQICIRVLSWLWIYCPLFYFASNNIERNAMRYLRVRQQLKRNEPQ